MSPRPRQEPPAEPGTGDGDKTDETLEDGQDVDALQARIAELEQQLEETNAADGSERIAELEGKVSELEQQLEEANAGGQQVVLERSGKSRKVTYLGRPELLAHGEDGEPTEEDVYHGTDPWSDTGDVSLKVGESAVVSEEKAAQLAEDHAGAFEIE